MRRDVVLVVGALLMLPGTVLPGCQQGSGSAARDDEGTSGGERTEDTDARRADRSAGPPEPSGPREPETDDDDTEELGPAQPASSTAAATDTPPPAPRESPWGRPETESGEPLPPRREMTGSARDAYRRGLQAARSGDVAAAQRAFEEALRTDPNAFRAAYNLGVLADRQGNPDAARTFYQQALRIQPDYERAVEGIVRILVRQQRAADAVAFVEPIARRWVRNLAIQAVYGEALIAANRPEEAVTAARAALRRDERFVPAMIVLIKANLRLGRTELAHDILDRALAIDASDAELHFLNARRLQEQGQLGPAMQAYRRAVELRPDYADARMALALQLLAGANYDEAVREFEAVARLVPDRPEVWLGLGNAYRATKQWEKAKQQLDRVVGVQPRSAEAHYALGLLYLEAGADFPGLDLLGALRRAQEELTAYRQIKGPSLARDDPSGAYLEEIARSIEREQRRIEREAARRQREAERAARRAAEAGGSAPSGESAGSGQDSGGGGSP